MSEPVPHVESVLGVGEGDVPDGVVPVEGEVAEPAVSDVSVPVPEDGVLALEEPELELFVVPVLCVVVLFLLLTSLSARLTPVQDSAATAAATTNDVRKLLMISPLLGMKKPRSMRGVR